MFYSQNPFGPVRLRAFLAFAGLLAILGLSACNNTRSGYQDLASLSTSPNFYLTRFTQINLAEIQTGQLALQRSQRPEVQAYAQRLINDHQYAQQQVATLGLSHNVVLPTQPDPTQQATYQRLSGLYAMAFDSAFVAENIQGHQDAIRMAQEAALYSSSADVRNFAANQVPVLQEHLRLARQLRQSQALSSAQVPQ